MRYQYLSVVNILIAIVSFPLQAFAEKIVLSCEVAEKFESNLIKNDVRKMKFGVMINDANGTAKATVFGTIMDGSAESVDREYINGSCVDRMYPQCETTISITDSSINISHNQHRDIYEIPNKKNSYIDFDNQVIIINRYNGDIKWDHYWDPDTRNPPREGYWSHWERNGKCVPETQRKF
jgi:hypothetical protein